MRSFSNPRLPVLGILTLLLLAGCGEKSTDPPLPSVSPAMVLGEESTLEIMTWNIEWFPKRGQTTIAQVKRIIDTLDVDIVALQEIADTTAFRSLIRSLDGYAGFYSPDTYGDSYQKTGILYKQSVITVSDDDPILVGDWDAFPRPPMRFAITASKNGHTFDFILIVLHLKAGGDTDDFRRRQLAGHRLKDYLDDRIANDPEKDYIVAGDWNDEIDDPEPFNAFLFLIRSGWYHFTTTSLASDSRNASYIGYSFRSFIDHIMISDEVSDEYRGGGTYILRPDEVYDRYVDDVSDHRPVMAKFPVFR